MQTFNWQGHRGARGLVPENSIPAFLKALEYEVTTLELDVAVSKDHKIIVSHEPWFSSVIASHPNGEAVTKDEEYDLKLIDMDYATIKSYDCGQRAHPRFPEQELMQVHKPSLEDVVNAVKKYCALKDKPLPYWNIEIKSHPMGDTIFHPLPANFAELLVKELQDWGIYSKTTIQSFDIRPLKYLRNKHPKIALALLVENQDGHEKNLQKLGFIPEIYSCYHKFLDKNVVDSLHQKGMQVIPWTVNEVTRMDTLIEMGVDGIITDYPNRIEAVSKQ